MRIPTSTADHDMKTIRFPSGNSVPALGMGTWCIGEDPARRASEIASLHLGLDLGMSVIDTAEMYGEGRSEELVGEAIAGRRENVFLVSKVYPHNAGRDAVQAACERSLRRLKTDRIDLYLLHWRGNVAFDETIEGFTALQRAGKIREFGVSNLDTDDMREWHAADGGQAVAANQILYNLMRRGVEWDLLPWCRARGVPVMAYSPVEQGKLLRNPKLSQFCARHEMTPAQAALGWLLAQDDILVIPKASRPEHVRDNAAAAELTLTAEQLRELDRLFPPPTGPSPLAMI